MVRIFACVLAAALGSLPAQDKPAVVTRDDLPKLREAFAAAPAGERIAVLAVVNGGEPVLLTAGGDAAGKDLGPQTLLPLFAMAKVLAADAMQAQLKDKLDKGSGERVGERELTVKELLESTALLPDYYVLDGGDGTADAAMLRSCAAMAATAKMQLRATPLGASEFVLLEPLAFAGHYKDWTTMLRSTLAPRVPGLDPMSAETLSEEAKGRAALAGEDLVKLAAARPPLLRTLLTLQNVGTWLQWRAQQEALLWSGARMGRMAAVPGQPKEQRWAYHPTAMNTGVWLDQYPSKKAAFLWFGPIAPGKPTSFVLLQRAFEADLFANGDVTRPEVGGVFAAAAGGFGGPVATAQANAVNPLAGTRWHTAADAKQEVRITFGEANERQNRTNTVTQSPMVFSQGGIEQSYPGQSRMGDGISSSARAQDGTLRTLWIWPQPGFDKATRLGVVLLTTRMSGAATAAGGSMVAAIPQYFELVPEPK